MPLVNLGLSRHGSGNSLLPLVPKVLPSNPNIDKWDEGDVGEIWTFDTLLYRYAATSIKSILVITYEISSKYFTAAPLNTT